MPDSAEEHVSCRICMDPKDSYVSLFSHNLSMKVMEVADVQVEKDDGLPSSICTECEQDLEKCYEFRLKVQVSDKKLRENIKLTQVDIVECNIKEERYMDDGDSDNLEDKDSGSMDDEHYDDEPDVAPRISEETEEAEPDPLNHVVVVEENERKMEMTEEPSTQDDMVEEPQVQKIEEVALDPLVCMKQEAETEIMDVDSNMPDPFGPSSSVRSSELPISFSIPPRTLSSGAQRPPSPGGHSRPTVVRNQGPGKSFVLIPQLGINLNNKLLIPYVNINLKTNTVPQGSIHSGENVQSAASNSTIQSNLQSAFKNNEKSGTWSNMRSKKVKNQQSKTADNTVRTESYKVTKVEASKKSDCKLEASEALPFPDRPVEQGNLEGTDECFCFVCNTDFGFPGLLQDHKLGSDFMCRNCTEPFDSHEELEAHFFSHKKYKCEFCKKIFYLKKDLNDHKKYSITCDRKPTRVRCKICNAKFKGPGNLLHHMERRHSDGEPQPFTCSICSTSFRIQDQLRSHLLGRHEVYEGVECDICHRVLLGPVKLKYHIKSVHLQSPEACPICKKILGCKSTVELHMRSHEGEEKICHICGAKVKGDVCFKSHMYNHENRKYCKLCDLTFSSSEEKTKHYQVIHSNNNLKQVCELCGKVFKNPTILKNHIRLAHSDDKPYQCEECGAAFKTKSILKTHSRVHTNFKKYVCDKCGEGFKWRPTLAKHLLKCESNRESNQNDNT